MNTPAPPSDSASSPMGPPGASPFGKSPGASGVPGRPGFPGGHQLAQTQKQDPASKSMRMWQHFLGAGATPAQVHRFQASFLNAITQRLKKEAAKSRERRKKDARMAEGKD